MNTRNYSLLYCFITLLFNVICISSASQLDDMTTKGPVTLDDWLKCITQNRCSLADAPLEIKSDETIVMAAIECGGLGSFQNFEHASSSLKEDRNFVLNVVEKYGLALEYASPKLQNDFDVVRKAIETSGGALQYASPDLKKNKILVLSAVTSAGSALLDADSELQKDEDVVFAAVRQNGWSIKFASDQLQKDKRIVLAAVEEAGIEVLEIIDPTFHGDPDVLQAAFRKE